MKSIIYLFGLSLIFALTLNPQKKSVDPKHQAEIKQSTDSVEYELLVFEPGFESYLAKVQHLKEFYGNDYYKNWNIQYVAEWNVRAINPIRYGSFYENQIDYQWNINYGLDLNFTLYQFFQFIEEKYKIVLIKRK